MDDVKQYAQRKGRTKGTIVPVRQRTLQVVIRRLWLLRELHSKNTAHYIFARRSLFASERRAVLSMEIEMGHRGAPARRPRKGLFVSGPLPWAGAICMTTVVTGVILVAVAILGSVLLLRPSSPYLDVQAANLQRLWYDKPGGTLTEVRMSLDLVARNPNPHSSATFTDLECRVALAGGATPLAVLRAEPFRVPNKGVQPLNFVAAAEGATLGDAETDVMEAAVHDDMVPFGVSGETRTHWQFLGLVKIKQWRRWSCEIRFVWTNGTAEPFTCTSKPSFPFF